MKENSLESDAIIPLLDDDDGGGSQSEADRNTKKVRFKDGTNDEDTDMLSDPRTSPRISWKDKLLGSTSRRSDEEVLGFLRISNDEELEFLEGDIRKSIVNGIPAIDFSERIQQILFKEMELTVILKLLGKNIGYGALSNRINSLWNPSKPLHLMDIENGYYLAKTMDDLWPILDCSALDKRLLSFTTLPENGFGLAWIRLPGLPGFLYKKKILEEIGGIIGRVVRLDLNTDSRIRERFARMAVYINLDKPLIGQVLVNGMKQRVEYEALPTICFTCGRYGHTKEICSSLQTKTSPELEQGKVTPTEVAQEEGNESFRPWMVFERKLRNKSRSNYPSKKENKGKEN
ncbi:GroES-like zinc-binding alcohol dehydrogenase family protein [Gossypium australe]|uniref:GroES-like zinc-binding alcohol dehydrogenase family protein n=1 Tax=Gossypium australe TaxID=47621 RepID=A0A5B6VD65_9ROSI|nr:GroES-like zinc-binding alcohol dehydrogenase family protein [Gossypium australe]